MTSPHKMLNQGFDIIPPMKLKHPAVKAMAPRIKARFLKFKVVTTLKYKWNRIATRARRRSHCETARPDLKGFIYQFLVVSVCMKHYDCFFFHHRASKPGSLQFYHSSQPCSFHSKDLWFDLPPKLWKPLNIDKDVFKRK